jgi:phosphohistidine phosphatase
VIAPLSCYLVRHGESAGGPVDAERPLTAGGRRSVEGVARRLVERGVAVWEIRHSGLARARETAELLAAALHPRAGVRAVDGLGPDADPQQARRRFASSTEPVLLVGHLPHLAQLAALLVGGEEGVVTFRPATVACLTRGVAVWTIEWVLDAPAGPSPR